MAIFAVTTEASEALTTSPETLVQLEGSSTAKGRIVAWGVSFDGTTASDAPVKVELMRQTTAGTRTAATEVKFDPDSASANIAGYHSFTAEPTSGDILESVFVHPQGGIYVREYVPGREPVLDNVATERLAVKVDPAAAVNAVGWIHWEE